MNTNSDVWENVKYSLVKKFLMNFILYMLSVQSTYLDLWKHKPQENNKKDYISRNLASNNSSENN